MEWHGKSMEAVFQELDVLKETGLNRDSDDSEVPPVADTHDAVAMESLLPTSLSGSALQVQSWNGDGLLTDDPWSTSMTAFLTASCKVPADRVVITIHETELVNKAVGGVLFADHLPTA
jgi:hypothetical protein